MIKQQADQSLWRTGLGNCPSYFPGLLLISASAFSCSRFIFVNDFLDNFEESQKLPTWLTLNNG